MGRREGFRTVQPRLHHRHPPRHREATAARHRQYADAALRLRHRPPFHPPLPLLHRGVARQGLYVPGRERHGQEYPFPTVAEEHRRHPSAQRRQPRGENRQHRHSHRLWFPLERQDPLLQERATLRGCHRDAAPGTREPDTPGKHTGGLCCHHRVGVGQAMGEADSRRAPRHHRGSTERQQGIPARLSAR